MKTLSCLIKKYGPIAAFIMSFVFFLSVAPVAAVQADPVALAAPASAVVDQPSVDGSYMLQLFTGLVIVIISIVVLAWFAKRMNGLQRSSDGSLQIVGGLSMGARERVVLVQVGEKQLLLGVAPGRINTLHVLDDMIEYPSSEIEREAPSFSQHLVEKMHAAVSRSRDYRQDEKQA